MTRTSLPRICAIIGVTIGLALTAWHWYEYIYNPFHFPTWEEAQALGNYSPPALYTFIEKCTFVLCPGLFLQIFTIDAGNQVAWIMWTLAALMNGPIYYCIGMILAALIAQRE